MRRLPFCLFGWIAAVAGCNPAKPSVAQPAIDGPPEPVAKELIPAVAPPPIAKDSRGFALELFAELAAKPGNVCVSPFSARAALVMSAAGASGETLAEMRRVLRLPEGEMAKDGGLAELLAAPKGGGPDRGFEVRTANAIWAQAGYPWRPEFLQRLSRDFGAGLEKADFKKDPDGERRRINNWAEQETRGRIKELIGDGMITSDHRMVLANAIYFKGEWTVKFDPKRTHALPFIRADQTEVDILMMSREGGFRMHTVRREVDDDWRPEVSIADIPYKGGQLSMVVLLPGKPDGLPALLKKLTPALLNDWLSASEEDRKAHLVLPKFRLDSELDLKGPLQSLGMRQAFDPNRADFGNMHTGMERLFVDAVIQKAFVDVNEDGTEAAAATPERMPKKNGAPSFVADHPFLFLIRHVPTNTILFIGRYAGP